MSGFLFIGAVAIASVAVIVPINQGKHPSQNPQENHKPQLIEVPAAVQSYADEKIASYCQQPVPRNQEFETFLDAKVIPGAPLIQVPVISYHRITDDVPPSAEAISKARFKEHLQLLKDLGYATVTIEQLRSFMEGERALPAKTIAITFDDGWRGQLDAAKLMNEMGIAGTFYIVSGFFNFHEYMNQEEVIELSKNPLFEIGAHSHTHFIKETNLHLINLCTLAREMVVSKKILEDLLKKPVKSFAWPYGFMTKEAIFVASKVDFSSTVMVNSITDNKLGMSPLDIHRLNIDGNCTAAHLKTMLETGKLIKCD